MDHPQTQRMKNIINEGRIKTSIKWEEKNQKEVVSPVWSPIVKPNF
jgi:hypothetical protein